MAKNRFKSAAFEAIHNAVSDLREAGLVDKRTMRRFDKSCIAETPEFDAKAVASIRAKAKVSQAVFAAYMNTSVSTVQKWETGAKHPSGMAAKLLQVVQKHGLEVLA
ncbi:helix-turn-helix domain-containing protein [Paraburkholderia tropica]|uniref:helix-turn-helix domain-containing protein n=1 Tax=Paraburkholderia tropica TaxID=92647 RepID=UPI002AB2C599|nr:DNA-binding transcriptional regulator [Paraburkholderia tropica]